MSVVTAFINSRDFSKLLIKGKDQNFLTPEEINDAIPASLVAAEDLDQILAKIVEARIEVENQAIEEDEKVFDLMEQKLLKRHFLKKRKLS